MCTMQTNKVKFEEIRTINSVNIFNGLYKIILKI